jgi:cytochrome c556
MKSRTIIGIAIGVFAAFQSASAASEKSVPMPAAQLVEARHAAMMMSGAALGALKAQANAEDLKRAGFPAHGLNAWAKAIPGMFPPGTDLPSSHALPAVWTDRPGFEAAAQAFVTATAALGPAIAANDKAAYTAALDRVGKACSACHDKYRKPDEKR